MPKNKKPIESTRTSSRRQASKEALKQMQLLLDDEDEDAFVIPEEEDKKDIRLEPPPPPPPKKRAISPTMESPAPKKKYKLSHRKSSDGNDRDVIVLKSISNSNYVPKENTLELECFVEDLSEVQKQRRQKVEKEEKELQDKLEELLKSQKAVVVYKGEISSAMEVNELITNCGKKSIFKPSEIPKLDDQTPAFHLVMDPRLGLIVGTFAKTTNQVQTPPPITKSKLQISAAVKDVATIPQNPISTPGRITRTRKAVITTPTPSVQTRGNNSIPTRANSHGITTRGNANTPRSNNSTPSRGVPQNTTPVPSPTIQTRGMKATPTIQTRNNKATPPSSSKRPVANVPVEKPSKQVVDLTSEDSRNQADNREIAFNKLQGKTYPSLVVVARPHLRVTDLGVDRSKLDSKVKSVLMHPPTKFTEWLIQQGLIRAEQKCCVHSNTQLKLGMYSDVSKFPYSGGYVWISECCPQRFVSVFNGSIFEGSPHPPMVMLKLIYHWSCQTNIQNVTQWVKVDNLYVKGVYTWLRGVCTLAIQSRLQQLGGPGSKIEVGVISLGTTSQDGNQRQVKVEVLGVLETSTKYIRLRAVEPMPDGDKNFRKKFSKILEPILHWVHPASTIITDLTVDKATLHHMGFSNVFQTTSNQYNQSNRTIMEYLRRIVPRMFQNTLSLLSRQIIQQFLDELVWREWFGTTSQTAFDNIIAHLAEQTRLHPQMPLVLKLNKIAANPFKSWNGNSVNQTPSYSATPTPAIATSAAPTPVPAKTPVAEVKKYGRKKSNSPQVQVVQERPTKPVSPDVPEQMVPLENYYYGTIDPINTPPAKVTLNMKCPFCKSTFDNNILLQNHLFKHAHNVSNDAYLCRYCLTSVSTANELIHHVNKCHPGETKFDYGFVCLICEIHYMNPFVLGKHMSKEHIPHELPYQCGSCSFRCSNHKQVIDHFYMKHDGGSSIQCPFCLKSTTVWSGGRNVSQNIHYFIQHLQKHQKKQFAKRCGKCNLWFVQKEVLKEHQQKMHISLRGKMGLIPYPSPRNGVMVPKSKTDKNPCDAEVINFSSLFYNLSNNSICKECNHPMSSSKHFPSFDNCQNPNCQYSTCCALAMMTHNAKCKGLNSVIPPETLPFEMFCVCGFKEADGNSMAKHLAICEKKSAYPSVAEAKSATVMHSMLDILGLVRKPEETKNDRPEESKNESTEDINNKKTPVNSEVQEKNEGTGDSLKISSNEIDSSEMDVLGDEEMENEISNPDNVDDITVNIDPEEISDKDDKDVVCNEKSDVIDLDEDVVMNDISDESQVCELGETNNILNKTESAEIDHVEVTQNEPCDHVSEMELCNMKNKQFDTHQIETDSNEQITKEDHSEIEVHQNIEENTKETTMTDFNIDEDIRMENNTSEIEKDDGIKLGEEEIDNREEEDLKNDISNEDIQKEPTEKDIHTDYTEEKIDDIKANITNEEIENVPTELHNVEDNRTEKEGIESDQTVNEEITEDHIEKVEDSIEEEKISDCSNNEMEVNHTEEEIKEKNGEETIQSDQNEIIDKSDGFEEGTEIVESAIEEKMCIDDIENETEAQNLLGEDSLIDSSNCVDELIENIELDTSSSCEKQNYNDTNSPQENSSNQSDVTMERTIEDELHSNKQIEEIENNHETMNDSISGKDRRKSDIHLTTEPCTSQDEIEESIPPVDDTNMSTSSMEKNEISEIVDNLILPNGESCIQTENEDKIKDILDTVEIPTDFNSTQGSSDMRVD